MGNFVGVGDRCIEEEILEGFPILKMNTLSSVIGAELVCAIDAVHVVVVLVNE